MIDYQQIFHTGIRVPNIQDAMDEMGNTLGLTWAKVQETPGQGLWTPELGQQAVPLKFVYSAEGPQHVELLEGAAGSFWDGRQDPGVHHVGVWVDDVGAETQRCAELGWTVVGASVSPDEGYGGYSYVQPPSGPIVELVWSVMLPRFESWWAGGDL